MIDMSSVVLNDFDSDSRECRPIGRNITYPSLESTDIDFSVSSSKEECSMKSSPDNEFVEPLPKVQPHVDYKNILVTVCAGFIGSSSAQYGLERGDNNIIVNEMNDYPTIP